jgi:hypothetical protein
MPYYGHPLAAEAQAVLLFVLGTAILSKSHSLSQNPVRGGGARWSSPVQTSTRYPVSRGPPDHSHQGSLSARGAPPEEHAHDHTARRPHYSTHDERMQHDGLTFRLLCAGRRLRRRLRLPRSRTADATNAVTRWRASSLAWHVRASDLAHQRGHTALIGRRTSAASSQRPCSRRLASSCA